MKIIKEEYGTRFIGIGRLEDREGERKFYDVGLKNKCVYLPHYAKVNDDEYYIPDVYLILVRELPRNSKSTVYYTQNEFHKFLDTCNN